MLALYVGLAHKYLALHPHQGADGGCRDSVLPGSGLSYHSGLAHLPGQQDLTYGVVDFVGACVVAVFAFEVEAAAVLAAHPVGIVQWRWSACIVQQQPVVLFLEFFALDYRQVRFPQFVYALVEYLGDIGSSKFAVESVFIYLVTHIFGFTIVFWYKKSLS